MGMAASQARLLSLQARQSNLEYQGQQINQERSILSQQCTALYNSLLAMQVPTPPSTSDFTTIKYSGIDGASEFTMGAVKPYGDDRYIVEIQSTTVGDSIQEIKGSYVVTKRGENINCVEVSGDQNLTKDQALSYYVEEKDGTIRHAKLDDFDQNGDKYSMKSSDVTYYRTANGDDPQGNIDTFTDPDKGSYLIAGQDAVDFDAAMHDPRFKEFQWDRYEAAIRNTYGNSENSVKPDDFYVFITTSETGTKELRFALKTDVQGSDEYTNIFKFAENGKFTKAEEVSNCKLQFDTQGRITTLSLPSKYDENGAPVAWRDIKLVAEKVTDDLAYKDAYNKYEYAQYEYDKKQQEINAKTEVIQQEDRNLELKLQRLDNERQQITTEIEAVEKVVDDNIEATYKTFSG